MLSKLSKKKQKMLSDYNRALNAKIKTRDILIKQGADPLLLYMLIDFSQHQVTCSMLLDDINRAIEIMNKSINHNKSK